MYFQIADICDQLCDSDIGRVPKELPKDLPETYRRAVQNIATRGNTKVAHTIFQWMLAVKRPLTPNELRDAISLDHFQESLDRSKLATSTKRLLATCGNLILHEEPDGIISFARSTVRLFLSSDSLRNSSLSAFTLDLGIAERHIATICLTYLNLANFERQLVHHRHPPLNELSSVPTVY